MGVCTSAGKGTTEGTEFNNIIKDVFGLSNKDIKKIEGVVDSYDYTPRILYRDYMNNPEYRNLKKLNDTYDATTKTIQVQKPSASIEYLLDNMPSDYTKPYISNGKRSTNMKDDYEKYQFSKKYYYGTTLIRDRKEASDKLYNVLKNSVHTTTRYKDGKYTKHAMTSIPKDAPKFLRESAAVILMERLKNKIN